MAEQDEGTSGGTICAEPPAANVRSKAFRRSIVCAGAGAALVGRGALAATMYAAQTCTIAAFIWLSLQPSAASAWTTAGLVAAMIVLSLAEQIAIRRPPVRPPGPAFLVGGFRYAVCAGVLGAVIATVLLVASFRKMVVGSNVMSPTLAQGEQVICWRRVDPEQLRRGRVILFKNSPESRWGKPSDIMASRILAIPGDKLSVAKGAYLVNGEPGPAVAKTGNHAAAVNVPRAPGALTVPPDSYFVVQDSPTAWLDSRVLSFVRRQDIISTRLYYLGRGILRPVE